MNRTPAQESKNTKKKKVLVADDDPSILRLVEMVLTRHGIEVVRATNGEEAVQNTMMERPDAVLLDVQMPKLDGFQVCSKLKANQTTAHIPVAFITARKDIDSYRQAQELGSILYVTKPFKTDRLLDVVGLLLASRGVSPQL